MVKGVLAAHQWHTQAWGSTDVPLVTTAELTLQKGTRAPSPAASERPWQVQELSAKDEKSL